MEIGIKVNRAVSYKDITRIVTRGKGIIRRPETLTNRHPKRVTLRTQLVGNVRRIISGNVVKELHYVTSVVKRVILLEDAPPRSQTITNRTRIKDHSSVIYKL